jgi:hypothetical protein
MTLGTGGLAAAIAAVAGLALWLLKKFFGKRGDQDKLLRLQKEVDDVSAQISKQLRNPHLYNFAKYTKLHNKRLRLNREIARLRKAIAGSS